MATNIKTGYLSKRRHTISKLWDHKYFVLQQGKLSYYKNPQSQKEIDSIILDKEAAVSISTTQKRKFTVLNNSKKWTLRVEIESELDGWVKSIHEMINPIDHAAERRSTLLRINNCFGFFKDKSSKQYEFWQVWMTYFPDEAASENKFSLSIATSASMQKLAIRMEGPQLAMVQKTVDFFWSGGSTDEELDRMNDLGAYYNPTILGSYMELSAQGGMDGGWFFPVLTPIGLALEAADYGHATRTLLEWADKHKIINCFSFGRDVGASPPWQTEVRVKLAGNFPAQVRTAMDTFSFFGYPSVPFSVQESIELAEPEDPEKNPIILAISTTRVGFARLSVLIPNPSPDTISSLCSFAPGDLAVEGREKLEKVVGSPIFIELTYLADGFGYGVYQEGFDVLLHYKA